MITARCSSGLGQSGKHWDTLGNCYPVFAKQTIILEQCALRFSLVRAREHAAGRSNFRSN